MNIIFRAKLEDAESAKIAIAKLAKEILEKDKEKDVRLAAVSEESLQKSKVRTFVVVLSRASIVDRFR